MFSGGPDLWSDGVPGPVIEEFAPGVFGESRAAFMIGRERDTGAGEIGGVVRQEDVLSVCDVVSESTDGGGDDWAFAAKGIGDFDAGATAAKDGSDHG